MALFHAISVVPSVERALALADALDLMDPAPLATETLDHDDGSGRWDAGGIFEGRPDEVALSLLAKMSGAANFRVTRIEEKDWVSQVRSELTPVSAGRFVVFGSHDRSKIPVNRIGLEIEAAQAFGTGHHATTQGCLMALDLLARRGSVVRNVADIGGGTGVLAMAAVALWRCAALAGDIDPVATKTARENVKANGFASYVRCVTAAGTHHPEFAERAPFDLICANILAGPLKKMAPQIAAHQRFGGGLVLSGLLARQTPAVERVYQGWGYRRTARFDIGDWRTLMLVRAAS